MIGKLLDAKNEHLRWHLPAQISVGDTVEIRLLDVPPETVDLPIVEADPTEAAEHRRFLRAKAQYLSLRDKFEGLGS